MIKLKQLLEAYLLKNKGYDIFKSQNDSFVIGPDGNAIGFNRVENHGHAIFKYPKMLNRILKDFGWTRYDLIEASEAGDFDLYKGMYSNGFIRGGFYGRDEMWVAFYTITNKQKDTIIDIIEKMSTRYEKIRTVTIDGKKTDDMSLSDFFRKYLM